MSDLHDDVPELLHPDGVSAPEASRGVGAAEGDGDDQEPDTEFVTEPAKVMRVGSMVKQLLDEVRTTELDGPARVRLKGIYERSIAELGTALSPDLREELDRIVLPFSEDEEPSKAELQIAQAQLVGWLEGLFHGIQATLFAQQMAAQNQLEDMRRQLTAGGQGTASGRDARPGTYL